MARISTKKNLVKDVNYLNKDFSDFRDNLIEFAKIYFPFRLFFYQIHYFCMNGTF